MGGKSKPAPAPPPPPPPQQDMGAMYAMMGEMMSGMYAAQGAAMNAGPSADELAAQEEERRLEQGRADRDDAYLSYLDAANTATEYVNSQIDDERANAALMGIDYVISDEDKASRVNDYFASIFSEGAWTEMEWLFREFGDPDDFEGFTIRRGVEQEEAGPETLREDPRRSLSTEDDEEEETLGNAQTSIAGA